MGQPAAKQGDQVIGVDTHIVMVPAPPGPPVPTPLPHPFSGALQSSLSTNVKIMGQFAATVGSVAINQPPHIPTPPGISFQAPPTNQGNVTSGSTTVKISGKFAARSGDPVQTCTDVPASPSRIVAVSTVMIG